MGRLNKNTFKKMVRTKKMIGRCRQHLTDDYAYDLANNFGKTEYKPLHIIMSFRDWLEKSEYRETFKNSDTMQDIKTRKEYQKYRDSFTGMVLNTQDLKMSDIYTNEDGTFTMYIHSNLSYDLKLA